MIVTVHALFSSNKLIGSRAISIGTKHLAPDIAPTPSHVAILINNRWVHESTGSSGIRVVSYEKWSEINNETGYVTLLQRDYQEIADMFRLLQNKKYDFGGLLYLALWVGASFFGVKIPSKNKFQSKNRYFCCEVLGKLLNKDYGMKAPVQIFKELKDEYAK